MKEKIGQFPSKKCHCHIQEPYGFVPEMDCPEHDTVEFFEFLDKIKQIPFEEGKQMKQPPKELPKCK